MQAMSKDPVSAHSAKVLCTELLDLFLEVTVGEDSENAKRRFVPASLSRLRAATKPHTLVRSKLKRFCWIQDQGTTMPTNVQEMFPPKQSTPARDSRFFKVQIKGWLDFDPTGREFKDIAQAVENGSGLVSMTEVTQVANGLQEISDPEIRERFADIIAINRILRNLVELPSSLKTKLHRALKNEPSPGGGDSVASELAS